MDMFIVYFQKVENILPSVLESIYFLKENSNALNIKKSPISKQFFKNNFNDTTHSGSAIEN